LERVRLILQQTHDYGKEWGNLELSFIASSVFESHPQVSRWLYYQKCLLAGLRMSISRTGTASADNWTMRWSKDKANTLFYSRLYDAIWPYIYCRGVSLKDTVLAKWKASHRKLVLPTDKTPLPFDGETNICYDGHKAVVYSKRCEVQGPLGGGTCDTCLLHAQSLNEEDS